MKSGLYFTCPYCSKVYQGIIPRHGDGTGVLLPKHYIHIPNSNNLGITITPGKKIMCNGSYTLLEIKEGSK